MRKKDEINLGYVKSKTELAKVKAANLRGISVAGKILGSGELNRDGVPRLPPDQREVKNWPVLDLGIHPKISRDDWRLKIGGLVEEEKNLNFQSLLALPQTEDISDFHCVTGWSQFNLAWKGVRFSDLYNAVAVLPRAKFIYITGSDNYSTNLRVEEALKYDVLLAYQVDGQPLPTEHGGPVRMITPQLWAWKGAKWINGIEFLEEDRRGFWEERGYSNSAIPWLNDRYTKDEAKD